MMKIALYPDGRACLELDGEFRDVPANMVQGFLIGLAMLSPTPFNWNAYLLSAWVAHSEQATESSPPVCVAGFDGTNIRPGVTGGGGLEAAVCELQAFVTRLEGKAWECETCLSDAELPARAMALVDLVGELRAELPAILAAIAGGPYPPKQGRGETGTPAPADSGDSRAAAIDAANTQALDGLGAFMGAVRRHFRQDKPK